MIEDFEDLDRLRAESEQIDVHKYGRRRRGVYAILLGAFLAGLVWLVLEMLDQKRNPCERVAAHACVQDPAGVSCKMYTDILRESVQDESKEMREQLRSQCLTRINKLIEDGVRVP